jgi:hypothetical protein
MHTVTTMVLQDQKGNWLAIAKQGRLIPQALLTPYLF